MGVRLRGKWLSTLSVTALDELGRPEGNGAEEARIPDLRSDRIESNSSWRNGQWTVEPVITSELQRSDGAIRLRHRPEAPRCGRFPHATMFGNADETGRTLV